VVPVNVLGNWLFTSIDIRRLSALTHASGAGECIGYWLFTSIDIRRLSVLTHASAHWLIAPQWRGPRSTRAPQWCQARIVWQKIAPLTSRTALAQSKGLFSVRLIHLGKCISIILAVGLQHQTASKTVIALQAASESSTY
jgi:hypothetical protein